MRAFSVLAIISGITAVSADCAAPGDYDNQGRYSCNPAHQYPNGQTCKVIEGCPLLCDADGKPIMKSAGMSTSSAWKPTPTCVAGGSWDTKGRYSCNPAHQYPEGQSCKMIDGCPLLCDADGKPVMNHGAWAAHPTATNPASKCPTPGDWDDKGRYSCNPAHQYPNGQSCVVIDGCPFLCDTEGKPIVNPDHGNNNNKVQPTGVPIITNAASTLKGGMALAAAALAAFL